MPQDQLIDRRSFLATLGTSAAGLLVAGGGVACGGGERGLATETAVPTGRIAGRVVDLAGTPQPLVGSVYLMRPTGQQTGQVRAVDPFGAFAFDALPAGDWQLRYRAPGVAYVAQSQQNPRRVTVRAGETLAVDIAVERAVAVDDGMIEIYAGDYFFQEQPSGKENAEVVVSVGTDVCWYNVGLEPHQISGSWGDSPTLGRGANYIWTPTTAGTYAYRCSFHPTQMIALLRVTA